MEKIPLEYDNWIKTRLFAEQSTFDQTDINMLYNLHNNYINPNNPADGKGCSSCVRRTLNVVREALSYLNN